MLGAIHSAAFAKQTRRGPETVFGQLGRIEEHRRSLHAGIFPEEDQDKVNRVANSVCNDRHGQVALRAQIDHSQ